MSLVSVFGPPLIVAGQWGSGKTLACRHITDWLGGDKKVLFLSDRVAYALVAIDHLTSLGYRTEPGVDGGVILRGRHADAYLRPGERLDSVSPDVLRFHIFNDGLIKEGRLDIGRWVMDMMGEQKIGLLELAVGFNIKTREQPDAFQESLSHFLDLTERVGVNPSMLRVLYVEAGYDIRWARNQERDDPVPERAFQQYASEAGQLTKAEQEALEHQGAVIIRVPNGYSDEDRFRQELHEKYEALLSRYSPEGVLRGQERV